MLFIFFLKNRQYFSDIFLLFVELKTIKSIYCNLILFLHLKNYNFEL